LFERARLWLDLFPQLSSRAISFERAQFPGAPFFSRLNFSAEPFLLNLFAAILFRADCLGYRFFLVAGFRVQVFRFRTANEKSAD